MGGTGGNKALGAAAAVLGVVILCALAGTVFFLAAGARARRSKAVSPPVPTTASARPTVPRPMPQSPSRPRPTRSEASGSVPQPTFTLDGTPLDWTCSKDQHILLHEAPAKGGQVILVILGTDYSIQGTLFLGSAQPVLPSNFLVKEGGGWGKGKRFGGQDVLLGVAGLKGPYDERALRAVASSEAWWRGRAKPAFQMGY